MQPQVVIIGLDALDLELVSQWAHDGHMPHCQRLMNASRWGRIRNPFGLEAGA